MLFPEQGLIEISLGNEKKLPAKFLGSDPLLDLAILEVKGEEIDDVIELGQSEKLEPGETAIAIGNPLGFLHGNNMREEGIPGISVVNRRLNLEKTNTLSTRAVQKRGRMKVTKAKVALETDCFENSFFKSSKRLLGFSNLFC